MLPQFSIALPAYKAQFLKDCIKSILNQTYTDFELIILNDSSPEPVKEILSQFDDERIRYYENEKNIGGVHLVHNWNKCLQYAKGKYFIIMGDDDMLALDYLQTFQKTIEQNPDYKVYHCRTRMIDEYNHAVEYSSGLPEYETVYENIKERMFHNRAQFISDFVYNTQALQQAGGFVDLPFAWFSDDATSYKMMKSEGIKHINQALFYYRKNGQSITSAGNLLIKRMATLQYRNWLIDFLKEEPTSELDILCKKYILDRMPQWKTIRSVDFLRDYYDQQKTKGFLYVLKNKSSLQINTVEIYKQYFFYLLRKVIH